MNFKFLLFSLVLLILFVQLSAARRKKKPETGKPAVPKITKKIASEPLQDRQGKTKKGGEELTNHNAVNDKTDKSKNEKTQREAKTDLHAATATQSKKEKPPKSNRISVQGYGFCAGEKVQSFTTIVRQPLHSDAILSKKQKTRSKKVIFSHLKHYTPKPGRSSVKFPIGTGDMDVNQAVEIEVVPMYKDKKKCSKTIHHKPIYLQKTQKVIRLGVCDFEKGTCGGIPTHEAPVKKEKESNEENKKIKKSKKVSENGNIKEASKDKKTEKKERKKDKKSKMEDNGTKEKVNSEHDSKKDKNSKEDATKEHEITEKKDSDRNEHDDHHNEKNSQQKGDKEDISHGFQGKDREEEKDHLDNLGKNKKTGSKQKKVRKKEKGDKEVHENKKSVKQKKSKKTKRGNNNEQAQAQSKEKTVYVHGYGFCAAQDNHVQSFVVTVKQDVDPTGKLSKNQKKSGRNQKTLFHHTKIYNTDTGRAGTNFLLGKATIDTGKPVSITIEPRYKGEASEKCNQKIDEVIQPRDIVKGSINLGVCDFEKNECHGKIQKKNQNTESEKTGIRSGKEKEDKLKTGIKSGKDEDEKSKNSKSDNKKQKKGKGKTSVEFQGYGFCPNSSEHIFTITVTQGGRTVLRSKEGKLLDDTTTRQSAKLRRVKRAALSQKTKETRGFFTGSVQIDSAAGAPDLQVTLKPGFRDATRCGKEIHEKIPVAGIIEKKVLNLGQCDFEKSVCKQN